MTYIIWIDLGNDLWHYEEASTLIEAIGVGDAINAADIIHGEDCFRKVENVWSSYRMVTIDVIAINSTDD